ncbi:MAG TPA: hypothetical protein VLJ37_07900 [bacterium]|nr:hypothetical protein [bacterium]
MRVVVAIATLLASAPALWAADLGIGTWARRDTQAMTMTIEPFGATGWKITYHITMGSKVSIMSLESALDGSEAAVIVDGKPSGETMAIKRLDDRHTFTTLKMNGQPFGTSKAELSADGKTINVQNETPSPTAGGPPMKSTETWDRK